MKNDIGERIKQRRLELGLSQTELAQRLNVKSKASVSKVEIDGSSLNMNTIRRYAKALCTTPSWLMGLSDSHEPSSPETLTTITKAAELDAELLDYFHQLDFEARESLLQFLKMSE